MPKPQRIQLSRREGFSLHVASMALNGLPAVKVDRTTRWGNPFIVGTHGTRAECVDLHWHLLAGYICLTVSNLAQSGDEQRTYLQHAIDHIEELRGKNLACWCPLAGPCHADALLKAANRRRKRPAEPARGVPATAPGVA